MFHLSVANRPLADELILESELALSMPVKFRSHKKQTHHFVLYSIIPIINN